MDKEYLIEKAKSILELNYLEKFTKPAPSLYPYQWNWDSGFMAMAYTHYDTSKAITEIESLFEGQWSNGMVPQIVFHKKSNLYFPGPEFWKTEHAKGSPKKVQTSGITMPPVHGFVLRYMYDNASPDKDLQEFLEKMWEKVIELHRFLYTFRDPLGEGLPCIIHPWESGTDNSPIFDSIMEKIDLSSISIPDYERKDLQSSDAKNHRPVKKDYDRYVYLVDLFRNVQYDADKILDQSPFLVQDPMFCSILSRSNKDLIYLGNILGKNVNEILEWDKLTSISMNAKMWDDRGIYNAYNLRNDEVIEVYSNSGFVPLLAGIPDCNQAHAMLDYFNGTEFGGSNNSFVSCPTHALDHEAFDSQRYWRGPVWINLNWMISVGLIKNGFLEEGRKLRMESLDLIRDRGFFEYFDPSNNLKGEGGYGSDNFSWTAAFAIIMSYSSV